MADQLAFEQAFNTVLTHEAGFQKLPNDKGNWTGGAIGKGELRGTKWGISAAAYPQLDIEHLTPQQAKGIYYSDYWLKAGCDEWPPEVAGEVFDAAVHSGPGAAVMLLQRAVGATPDGIIGPNTRNAVAATNPIRVAARLLGWRLERMTQQPQQWADFGKGFARRIAAQLKVL